MLFRTYTMHRLFHVILILWKRNVWRIWMQYYHFIFCRRWLLLHPFFHFSFSIKKKYWVPMSQHDWFYLNFFSINKFCVIFKRCMRGKTYTSFSVQDWTGTTSFKKSDLILYLFIFHLTAWIYTQADSWGKL